MQRLSSKKLVLLTFLIVFVASTVSIAGENPKIGSQPWTLESQEDQGSFPAKAKATEHLALLLLRGAQGGTELQSSVGQELVFNADDFANLDSIADLDPMHARYLWRFGDGSSTEAESRSAVYSFPHCGTFTVTLEVTPIIRLHDNGTPDNEDDDSWHILEEQKSTFTKDINVSGPSQKAFPFTSVSPVMSLHFDGTIEDSSPSRLSLSWRNGVEGNWISGLFGKGVDLSGGQSLELDTTTLFSNRSSFTLTFWAKIKDDSQSRNCILWQGSPNSYQPQIRSYFIEEATYRTHVSQVMTAGGTAKETVDNLQKEYSWHHYAYSFSSEENIIRFFIDGELKALKERTLQATAVPGSYPIMIGYGEININGTITPMPFNGFLDELNIYPVALQEKDFTAFSVIHADMESRSGQKIIVRYPGFVAADQSNRLLATISGGALATSQVIADKTDLSSEEAFLLLQHTLPGSAAPYSLNVKLLDGTGGTLYERHEYFTKPFDGYPSVGIDENNSIRVNGQLFFPVTPWGIGGTSYTNLSTVDTYVDNGYINSLYGQCFWPIPRNLETYGLYLDHAEEKNVGVIGPSLWDGKGNTKNYGTPTYNFNRCGSLTRLREYVNAYKSHPAKLVYQWGDEPELYGIAAPQVRSYTAASHLLDPGHPVATNFMGHPYAEYNGATSWWGKTRRTYTIGHNQHVFGRNTPIADILGFDYYPLDQIRDTRWNTMHILGTIMTTIREENLDLLPVMSWVETTDPSGNTGTSNPSPWKPSQAHLKMITWFNVVNGAKGINWFHYFGDTPAENLEFMSTFTRQITELTPAVLGPESGRSVSVQINGGVEGRVDTLLREYNGELYLIAVRVSESLPQSNSITTSPLPDQDYPISVTFQIDGSFSATNSTVYEEDRTIPVSSGSFTDSFAPYEVHIYSIGI